MLPTPEDGLRAMRTHAVDKAWRARAELGPIDSLATLERLLTDDRFVRHPTAIVFDRDALQPGEMAWARKRSFNDAGGYDIVVNPVFAERVDAVLALVAYQLVTVNYGPAATYEEAELFGCTLLNMDREAYYEQLCTLADEVERAG